MDYLPIFLNIKGEPCLVVGGGEVAARKVQTLLRAGGKLTVVAPELGTALAEMAQTGAVAWRNKTFTPKDIAGFRLVIAATDDSAVNTAVSKAAQARHVPVNVVDRPALCSFIFPALVDRSPVVLAVSSGGASPVLARVLKARLETLIPPAYGRLAELAERFRSRAKQALREPGARRKFWETVLQGPVADLVLAGRENEAAEELERALLAEAAQPGGARRGMVYLVGAGPGDPDLLTLRALRLMQEADVVVYDRLVSAEILDLVRRDAEKIYAGKQRSNHTLPQEEINRLLADLAKQGKRVVRLKGGDPFIFGRGGEEIETLAAEGVSFQIVPGITAASGCAAYAGIPLTHREHAQICTFLTGHLKDGRVIDPDWEQWVRPNQTLVFYMGLQGLPEICAELIRHGSPPDLPAALIQQGTTRQQKVLAGTLSTLPELVLRSEVRAPTLLIIGKVVSLRDKLAWFETG
jgi:uroporphyrin-III C-methyltransferase/precorrin-2 dehydrogenase/sirohydrochlorin ferrochelatase